MIGPKTREFAEIDISASIAESISAMVDKGAMTKTTPLTVVYSHTAKLAMTARSLVKENFVPHPSFLFGSWWFLHYQAWLWKLSKGWREQVLEHWLKDKDLIDVEILCHPGSIGGQ